MVEKAKSLQLLHARGELARLSGAAKRDFLLGGPSPGELIRALPASDVYFAVMDIGLEDSSEIVALASVEQFKAFVDLDCWRRDVPQPRSVLHWLQVARQGAGLGGLNRYKKKLLGLDIEMLELVLKTQVTIHDLKDDEDPTVTAGMFYRTPEGRYLIEFSGDGAEYGTLRKLFDDLFSDETLRTARLVEAVRWESAAELAEACYQWRTGRLRDLGIPSLEESLAFFAPPKGAAFPAATLGDVSFAGDAAPGSLVPSRGTANFNLLDAAVRLVPDEAFNDVQSKLAHASNAVLVADSIDPADSDSAREALSEARATLTLGLWLLSAGDVPRAAELLVDKSAKELFHAGVAEGLRVRQRAEAAARRLVAPGSSRPILDGPISAAMSSLRRKRPSLPDRPLGSPSDVLAAEALIAKVEALARFADAIGLTPERIASLAEEAGRAPQAISLGAVLLSMAAAGADAPVALSREAADALAATRAAHPKDAPVPFTHPLDKAPDAESRAAAGEALALAWAKLASETSAGPVDWSGASALVVQTA